MKREIERAAHQGIPIVPFRIEDISPSEAMEYFISSHHWMDALTPPLESHLEALAATLAQMLGAGTPSAKPPKPTKPQPDSASAKASLLEAKALLNTNPDRALELLDKALQHDPKLAEAWFLRGFAINNTKLGGKQPPQGAASASHAARVSHGRPPGR